MLASVLVVSLVAAAEPDEAPAAEVVVVDPGMLGRAHGAVVDKLVALGWRAREKADGRVVFRGPRGWMGSAVLSPDGDLGFRHGAIWLPGPARTSVVATPNTDVVWMSDNQVALLGPAAVNTPRARLATFGPRLPRAAQREVAAAVAPELGAYRRTLWAVALKQQLERLTDELAACWDRGVPVGGGAALPDPTARRRALLEFWATRTDTDEGRAVMRTTEAFLRNVVMASAWPATAEEIRAAEARRDDGAKLQLGE
jgi:hypothetical protein